MALRRRTNDSYGLSNPLQNVFPLPVKANRNPTARDTGYEIGQVWVNVVTSDIFLFGGIVAGVPDWQAAGLGLGDVGNFSLLNGLATIIDPNVKFNDIILLSRVGLGASTDLGFLEVSLIPGVAFIVTSHKTPVAGGTEAGDQSIIDFIIIRGP